MNREPALDYFVVWPQHIAVHDRLQNWSRYVCDNGKQSTHPMFRQYRSTEIWAQSRETSLTDSLDGHQMEKAVCALPEKHRDAIRWSYVFWRIPPSKMCKHLAVSRQGLALLIHDARSMLKNRGTR